MAVEKNRQLKPGPAGKTVERAHYIRLMKQGFNNSEPCRIVGVGRKTGSHWRKGRTVRDTAMGRVRSYAGPAAAAPALLKEHRGPECAIRQGDDGRSGSPAMAESARAAGGAARPRPCGE